MLASASLAVGEAACSSDDSSTTTKDGGSDATSDASDPEGGGDAASDVTPDAGSCEDAGSDLPNELRCTGLYTDFAKKTVAQANKEYAPGLVFWSDGAVKTRWLYLPDGTKIDTSNMDEWVFPVGTRVWKEFKLSGHRVETRVLYKMADATWVWATYRWNDDESDARRVDLGVADAGNGYEIPNNDSCIQCHGGRNDRLLGVEAMALGLPSASGVTLSSLVSEHRLTVNPPQSATALPGQAVDQAALGWLHMNCGVACHNRNPSAGANFTGLFMRLGAASYFEAGAPPAVNQTDVYTTGVDHVALAYAFTYPPGLGYRIIVRGDAGHSVIPLADSTRGPGQMPPIATHKVDDAGVSSVVSWINQLP